MLNDNKNLERKNMLINAGLNIKSEKVPLEPFLFETPVNLGDVEIGTWNCIGQHTYVNSGFIRQGVEIGRYCSIGRNVTIGTGTHDMSGISTSPALSPGNNIIKYADFSRKKTVVIGHDVWVGDNSIIMTGVNIGTGAVIAAGSIVTKDVEPYSIVGGNYAKPLGKGFRFEKEIRDKLLASKWWEIPLKTLRESPFKSPEIFLEWLSESESALQRVAFLSLVKKL